MPTSFLTFNPGDLIEDIHAEQFITPIQNIENGKPWFGEDTGTTNTFEIDLDPAPTAYTEGMLVHFLAANDVTGVATLNINSLGVKSLLKEGGTSLASGDIIAGQMVSAIYDGANFHVVSSILNAPVNVTPAANLLVYSDATKEHTSTSASNFSLPSFTFDNTKTYLLEMRVSVDSNSTAARVTLNDGTTSYAYPSASTIVKGRNGFEGVYRKILPTLSGSHTVVVNAAAVGFVEVKLYEINDNLVYADFTPSQITTTMTSASLANFTATSGHTYLLKVSCNGYSTVNSAFAAYLTSGGVDYGIPGSAPATDQVGGGEDLGTVEVSRILTGLSGAYTVTVRSKSSSGVIVEIYDIT